MPTAGDPRLSGGVQLPLTHNPLQRINYQTPNPILDPAAIAAAEAAAMTAFLELLDSETGLDLLGFWRDYTAFSNQMSAALQQSWMNFQNFLNGLAQQTDADVEGALAWVQGQFNQLSAALQQSWLSFQNLINSVVGGVDKDVTDLIAALNSTGGDAATARANWDTVLLDLGFSVTDAAAWASWLGGTNTTATNNAAYAARKAKNDLIIGDWLHATYPVGSITDTAATLVGGKRTWWGAWNDNLILLGIMLGIVAPTDPASDIGGVLTTHATNITTAQSTANTGVTNAATANTAAGNAQSTANTNATRVARKAQNDLIIGDWLHATYPLGSATDTAATLVGGKRTWWGAWNDNLILLGILLGITAPTDPASDVGTTALNAQSTASTASTTASAAQSTATTASTNASTAITNAAAAQSTATTANTAAGTAQTTANTANTMFGLGQQAGTNLVLAPGFENTAAWTSASAGTQSTAQAHSGTNSWMLQGAGSGNTTTLRLINNSLGPTTLKSRVGEVFQLQGFVYPKTGNAGGGTVRVQIVCTDSTGVNSATTIVAATETVPATGSWSSLSGIAVVPSGYDTVDPQLILLSVPTTDFVYVDDVLVRETTLVTMAQDTANGASNDAGSALDQLTAVPQQNVVPLQVATGQPAALVASGAGTTNTGAGSVALLWADTIPSTANYALVVANTATTHGAVSATASVTVGGVVTYLPLVGVVPYASSGKLMLFGVANPPIGSVTFRVNVIDSTSLFSLASATSMALSNTVSLSVMSSSNAVGASPSLSTSFSSSQLVVNAIGTLGTGGSTVGLTSYNQTSRYHAGNFNGGSQFNMDLIAGTVSGVSSPSFTASVANTINEGYAALAVAVNPPPSILGSYARAYRSNTASRGTGSVGVAGQFGTVFDTSVASSDMTVDVSTGRITVAYSGTYLFKVGITFTGLFTTQTVDGLCYVNSQLFERSAQAWYASSSQTRFTWSTPVFLNAGDFVEPSCAFGSSSTISIVGEASGSNTYMSLSLLNRSLL